jgi:hypothetical protein
MPTARVKYIGATPGADAGVYILFSTALSECPQGFMPNSETEKVNLSLSASNNGTLKAYKAQVRDNSNVPQWVQMSTEAVTVVVGTEVVRDYLVSGLQDFKLEWTNGGSAQNPWLVDITLDDERSAYV